MHDMPAERSSNNLIAYIDPVDRGSYELVGHDPETRRAWAVRPKTGTEHTYFPTEREADEFARQHALGEVVPVDVLIAEGNDQTDRPRLHLRLDDG
jgi:hypothetical protein